MVAKLTVSQLNMCHISRDHSYAIPCLSVDIVDIFLNFEGSVKA